MRLADVLELTDAQRGALRHVAGLEDLDALATVFGRRTPLEAGVTPRLTINFHPDRMTEAGGTVIDGLARTGRYKNQFEVGYTNGIRSFEPGGLRDTQERELFGGYYQRPEVSPGDRPKYGSLTFYDSPHGGWPRFGSCHLLLHDHLLARTTVSVGDSIFGAKWQGIATSVMASVAAGSPMPTLQTGLDGLFEAQLHGPVDLARDVEIMRVDASFVGTPIERSLIEIERRHGVRWEVSTSVARDPALWVTRNEQDLVRRATEAAERVGRTCTPAWIGELIEMDLKSWTNRDSEEIAEVAKFLWHELLVPNTGESS